MTFDEFLAGFPDAVSTGPMATNAPSGLRYVTAGLPEFVGPDLVRSSEVTQPSNAQVVIVSASGAAGKSTLANQLATAKRAPIWDLAQADAVGANSMTGQISASFGLAHVGDVFAQLSRGEVFIIVDALDEATMKSNEAGFAAFITNIAQIAKTSCHISFVLLARTRTAQDTWLLLDDAGVATSLIAIQPFTREQAERYIDARIKHDNDTSAAKRIEQQRGPFIEARDAILRQLERAVVGDDSAADFTAREFLGYAPVLETVAVLLAKERNHHELLTDLNTAASMTSVTSDRPLAMLEHVVSRLLQRERVQKVQQSIKPALETTAAAAKWNSWDDLYSPEEQRLRLLARILDIKVDACPASLPAAVRARYEEQLAVFFKEHPFLRDAPTGVHKTVAANKVFESYLFAVAMRQYLTPLSKAVESRVSAADYRPSRLLSDFYVLLGDREGNKEVAERQIGLLYESLLAGETDRLKVRLSIDAGDPDDLEDEEADAPQGEFELVYNTSTASGDDEIETRTFSIVSGDGPLTFRRQLKDATIITRGAISLGEGVDDFEIGPAVDVRCANLAIHSTGVTIRARVPAQLEEDVVALEAHTCDSSVSKKPVVRGRLTVSWNGSDAYPWSDYSVDVARRVEGDYRMHEVQRRFRRIVGGFASHSKGGLRKFKGKIESRRVLKNRMGEKLLEKLLRQEILVLEGKFYRWVPASADDTLGISFADIRNRRWTPKAISFFEKFIADNESLF